MSERSKPYLFLDRYLYEKKELDTVLTREQKLNKIRDRNIKIIATLLIIVGILSITALIFLYILITSRPLFN
jgi:hypothetical protein